MIHFFLHWWKSYLETNKNKIFFQILCNHWSKLLIFPFAWNDELQEFEKHKHNFIKNNPDTPLSFTSASHDISQLIEQIKTNDILYFPWWNPHTYFDVINKIENFKEFLQNKIVAWTSWWAIMWSKAYYSSNSGNLKSWNGFIPVKMIAHRWAEKYPLAWREEKAELLDAYWEKLPIVKIPEQEYIEFII